ncbi:MAG: sigma-54-dependent Fis family transcriptional regulator [Myxococcales bacterium]
MDEQVILVVDDEANIRKVLSAMLQRAGYQVVTAEDGIEAIARLGEHEVAAIVTDLRMPGLDGMGLLTHVKRRMPDIPVVLITAHGSVDNAVEAIKAGAFDYVTKPFDRDEIRLVVDKAVRQNAAERARPSPSESLPGRWRLIGRSPGLRKVFDIVDRVAATPTTVLITGESGTGKELVASALHEHGRAGRPFVKLNCAAIPHELMESELFGHEKGAFTGAVASKPGRFELAHGGTLFLDEIGEIPPSSQVKLLRAVQQQEIERVGGVRTVKVDVRIVAATNRDLKTMVADGTFREDLYYRLAVVPIHLPPLRERPDDIPLLAESILARHAERLVRPPRRLTPGALRALQSYPWPGNVRELENVLERSLLFCDAPAMDVADLPPEVQGAQASTPQIPMVPSTPASPTAPRMGSLKDIVKEATEQVERDLITRALAATGDNVTHAARLLGLSRRGLQLKLRELGIRDPAVS